jgi:hypothetical protein
MVAPEQRVAKNPRLNSRTPAAQVPQTPAGSVHGWPRAPPAPDRRFILHPPMSSSKSMKRIPRPSHKALGAAAASAAVAGVVVGTCLSTTSAHGSPDAAPGTHSTVLSTGAAMSALGSVGAPAGPASNHAQHVVADKDQAPRHEAPAAKAAAPKATATVTSKPQAAAPEVGAKVVAHGPSAPKKAAPAKAAPAKAAPAKAAPHGHGNGGPFGHDSSFGHQSAATAIVRGMHHNAVVVHGNGQHGVSQHGVGRNGVSQHGVSQHGVSQHGVSRHGVSGHGVSQHGAGHHGSWHRVLAAPARPFQIYDSVTPSSIPGGKMVATYADGPYAVSPSQVQGHRVMWIDTNGSDPRANALDVEPGDATPQGAATWVQQRLSDYPHSSAIVYTMQSEWPATRAAVAALPHWMQHQVRWWIADPTGSPHVLPGASATQWYWGSGYDITTAKPGFWPNGR